MNTAAKQEFLDAIIADRHSLVPRLIYADWLEDHGDPQGEFIRIQCELATPSDDDRRRMELSSRQEELLKKYRDEWAQNLQGKVKDFGFRCGMVESVEFTAEQYLAYKTVFDEFPIRSLSLHSPTDEFWIAARDTQLPELESFHLDGGRLRKKDLVALQQVNFPHLQYLSLENCSLDDRHMPIVLSVKAPSLQHLNLRFNFLRRRSALHISQAESLSQLKVLILRMNKIDAEGARALAESKILEAAEFIDLANNLIPPRIAMQISAESNGRIFV